MSGRISLPIRRFPHSSARSAAPQVIFPHLKDKSPIVSAFHRDKSIPFNVLRDVLRFPHINQHRLDSLQHAWTSFVSVNDPRDLHRLILREDDPAEIWRASLRLANASPMIMNGVLTLWKDPLTMEKFRMPQDTLETLIGSLIYHQKYDLAFTVFQRYLSDQPKINWVPIIDVCISLESCEGMKVLSRMYDNCSQRRLHSDVLSHLRRLKLKDTYINKWNNVMVSQGDFSRNSSAVLDKEFQSMLNTSNLRSFKNCLKNLAKFDKNPDWLQISTTRLLSRYISQSRHQTEALFETLRACGGAKKPSLSFWADIYDHTTIPTTVLDTQLKSIGIPLEHPRIASSRLKRLSNENVEHFWKIVGSESRGEVLKKSSLSILSMSIKTSSIESAFDYCLHLLSLKPDLKDSICKTFIVEMSKKIHNGQIHDTNVLSRLETFLKENSLMNDKIHNLFIYSDLVLSNNHSAVARLEHLLSNPSFVVEERTVDNMIKFLRKDEHQQQSAGMFDDNFSYNILELTLKCANHCDELSSRTWRRILVMIGRDYEMEEVSKFFICVARRFQENRTVEMDSSNMNHPLRGIFDVQMFKKILEWGFMKTPQNPWSGFELIKELERAGVFVPENLMKKHLVRLAKVLHGSPGHSIPARLRTTEGRIVPEDISTTLAKVNGIQEGHFLTSS